MADDPEDASPPQWDALSVALLVFFLALILTVAAMLVLPAVLG